MPTKAFIAVPQITADAVIEAMRRQVREAGFEAVFTKDIQKILAEDATEEMQCSAICNAMKDSDLLLANLTPFLGVEPDPDVTFQLGYMAAQQKPVFSYTNVSKPFYERVLDWNGCAFIIDAGLQRDRDQMRIENIGIKDYTHAAKTAGPDSYNNLMLEGPSTMTGSLVLTPKIVGNEIPEEEFYTNLSVFTRAVSQAKQHVLVEKKIKANPAPQKIENPTASYIAGPGVFLSTHK